MSDSKAWDLQTTSEKLEVRAYKPGDEFGVPEWLKRGEDLLAKHDAGTLTGDELREWLADHERAQLLSVRPGTDAAAKAYLDAEKRRDAANCERIAARVFEMLVSAGLTIAARR